MADAMMEEGAGHAGTLNDDYIRGKLAMLVYKHPSEWGSEMPQELKNNGWKPIGPPHGISNKDAGQIVGPNETPYMGGAFINETTGQIVVAHRGTNPQSGEDWIANIQHGVGIESTPMQEADKFTRNLENLYPNANFSHAGHSQGGCIATVIGAKHGDPVTGLDSGPAAIPILQNMRDKGDLSQELLDKSYSQTTTIQSDGSAVEMITPVSGYPGKIIKLDMGDGDPVDRHDGDKMMNHMNPVTGEVENSEVVREFTQGEKWLEPSGENSLQSPYRTVIPKDDQANGVENSNATDTNSVNEMKGEDNPSTDDAVGTTTDAGLAATNDFQSTLSEIFSNIERLNANIG